MNRSDQLATTKNKILRLQMALARLFHEVEVPLYLERLVRSCVDAVSEDVSDMSVEELKKDLEDMLHLCCVPDVGER